MNEWMNYDSNHDHDDEAILLRHVISSSMSPLPSMRLYNIQVKRCSLEDRESEWFRFVCDVTVWRSHVRYNGRLAKCTQHLNRSTLHRSSSVSRQFLVNCGINQPNKCVLVCQKESIAAIFDWSDQWWQCENYPAPCDCILIDFGNSSSSSSHTVVGVIMISWIHLHHDKAIPFSQWECKSSLSIQTTLIP